MKKLKGLFLICNFAFVLILLTAYSLVPTAASAQSGWGPDMRLTYRQGDSYDPKAACNGDTIHLVWWASYAYAHEEVFYKRSTDAGSTWGPDTRLSEEDDRSSVLASIAVNGNSLYVVWQQYGIGICYRKSTDGGGIWLPIDTIPNGGSGNPSICVADSNVYVVAYRTDGKIIFSKSTDNGNQWFPSQEINFDIANKPRIENIGFNQDILILVCENSISSIEIYCKRSTDAGYTWGVGQCVSHNDSISGQRPALATDSSNALHVSWYDYKYSPYPWTGDIFYRASKDSGNTWEPIDSLTVMHRAVASDILAEGNNLHLVWEDDRFDFNHNFEIMYRTSTNLGRDWQSEERLTDTLNWSRRPSLACNGRYLHLFWFDLRDDTSNVAGEIYYKRKDLLEPVNEQSGIMTTPWLKLAVYPNPFSQEVQIRYTIHDTGYKIKDGSIRLFDVSGKAVISNKIAYESKPYTIDTRRLPAGIYFVQVEVDGVRSIRKVIKVK